LNVGGIEPHGTPMINANDRSRVIRFAQARARHYEIESDDLALWRIFYGRSGGEIPAG
jgi:hypothetical protein